MKSTAVFVVLLAIALAVLAAGLRPDTFWGGDPGIRLTSALNALEHPSSPLQIPLPTIGESPVHFVEPWFLIHGDHSHAITSELFPLISAPFVGAFGVRGIYLLPALGYLLFVIASASLAPVLAGGTRPLLAALIAAFTTPLLFYALEFWEHALAVGLAALGLSLWVRGRGVPAGLLFAAAIVLRTEAIWFVLVAVLLSHWLPPRGRNASPSTVWRHVALGVACLAVPYTAYQLLHFGTVLPLQLRHNSDLMRTEWFTERLAIARLWFGNSDESVWRTMPAVMIGLGLAALSRRPREISTFLWALLVITTVCVWVTAPNTGGAQWGPRYLLFATIPAVLLTTAACERLLSRGMLGRLAVALVLFLGMWTDRTAYKQLQTTKRIYGDIVDLMRQVPRGGYVVTDVWWLDQITALPVHDRHVLFAEHKDNARNILERLAAARVDEVTVMRDVKSYADEWLDGSVYRRPAAEIRRTARTISAETLRLDPQVP